MLQLEFPIEPTDTAIGVMQRPRAPGRGRLDRPVPQPALRRGDRRQPPPGHHRPGAGAQPRDSATSPAGSTSSTRAPGRCPGCRRTPASATSTTTSTSRSSRCPPSRSQDVVLDCAAKGVHGLVVISSGFAETGEEGRQRQRRLVGLSRSYGAAADRPELPRHHQHRPAVSLNASLSALMPPRGRAGLLLPVRRARLGDPGEGQQPGPRPVDVRQRGQPRRRLRQRPPAVLGGGRLDRGRAALPRVDRQPAQVLAGSPAGSRCASRSSRSAPAAPPRACRWATRCARSPRRRRPSTRCSARPG